VGLSVRRVSSATANYPESLEQHGNRVRTARGPLADDYGRRAIRTPPALGTTGRHAVGFSFGKSRGCGHRGVRRRGIPLLAPRTCPWDPRRALTPVKRNMFTSGVAVSRSATRPAKNDSDLRALPLTRPARVAVIQFHARSLSPGGPEARTPVFGATPPFPALRRLLTAQDHSRQRPAMDRRLFAGDGGHPSSLDPRHIDE